MNLNTSRANRNRRLSASSVAGIAAASLALGAPAAVQAADGRVFEQVSPPVKVSGGQVGSRFGSGDAGWSSVDGNGVLYYPYGGGLSVNPERGTPSAVLARRTPGGWTNVDAFPGTRLSTTFSAYGQLPQNLVPSPDLSSALYTVDVAASPDQPDLPGAGLSNGALLRGHVGGAESWTKPLWAGSTPRPGALEGPKNFGLAGANPDQTVGYFASRPALVAEDGEARPDAPASWTVYRMDHGQLTPAARLPDGTLDPAGAVPAGSVWEPEGGIVWFPNTTVQPLTHPVSRDGNSLLFVSPDPTSDAANTRVPRLYLTRPGQTTRDLTPGPDGVRGINGGNRDPDAPGSRAAVFAFASADHRFVFFATNDALTDDAGAPGTPDRKVYRYDTRTETARYLPELSTDTTGQQVKLTGVSDDGSRVLYAVQDAAIGTTAVRLWRDGEVRDLGSSAGGALGPARFSSHGRTVVFEHTGLLGDQDVGAPGTTQIYRAEDGHPVTCVSCGTVDHPATTATVLDFRGSVRAADVPRVVSADAEEIFFQSDSALVAEDHNEVTDVYEWRNGAAHLLSGGREGAHNSYLRDSSASGNDVFFATDDRLAATDVDGAYDLYDARVGGGFPAVPPVVECAGDACQAPPSSPASSPSPSSTAVAPTTQGSKEQAAQANGSMAIKRVKASTSRVTLRVVAPSAGRLVVSGTRIKTATRVAARGATYTVKATLTAKARSALRRSGRLVVSVRVRFTPTSGKAVTKTAKLTIKSAKR